MDYFVVWCIFAVLVGVGGSMRGRNGFAWWMLAMAISPLLAVILLFLAPIVKDEPSAASHVKCPDCAELVLAEARKCKHCGSALVPAAASAQPAEAPTIVAAPDTSYADPRRRT